MKVHAKSSYISLGKPRVVAVVGPTSSGKTALGIYLAQKLRGEVISADSRQVYKGLNIGAGKVTKKEMTGIPHHLLDIASPKRVFSADDFKKLGERAITMIYHSKKIPIVVGGTGLYADVLLGRMALPEVPPNPKLRAKLEAKSVAELYALLLKKDPERANNIEPNHKRRLVRALEIADALGKSPAKASAMDAAGSVYDVLWLGLNPPQKILHKKIVQRLHARLKAGMVAEAKKLHAGGLSYKRMEALGLEYRYLARILKSRRAPSADKAAEGALLQKLEREIMHYAKRQLRWFKRNPSIVWVKNKSEALKLSKEFLK
ncbi:MAG TPA: tRNA (adenosine(37)-N6)-dimethylallyltransferase MiaA [Candidatus Paceibacterota bacterium]|nr:tRNA (adenosine(37)-N6)-dimethylallyltransferase MiaA [Candidatus Paceibacterota bacterium]